MESMRRTIKSLLTTNRVWKSFFRHGRVSNDLNRALVITSNVVLHLHPVKVRKDSVRFGYTLGLGGISCLLFIILVFTGVLLAFYYVPSAALAYQSIKDIEMVVSYGRILRNMHRWAAHGMVITVLLHMCRVFYTNSYSKPREFNWVVGVGLLLLTLGLSFTGYLLPWDQLAFWAITVGTSMASYAPVIGEKIRYFLLGGNIVGQGALIRFYVLHCFVLPSVMVLAMALHFWRIRKDGGISGPELATANESESISAFPERSYGLMEVVEGTEITAERIPENTVFTWTHLIPKELLATIVVLTALNLITVFFNAPLEEMANATVTPNPAKAPWYFLGLQELVHYSAFFGGVLLPALIVVGLVVLPYTDVRGTDPGVWFSPKRKTQNAIFSILVLLMFALIIVGTFFRGQNWKMQWPW
ncbi:MAG: cytochrome b N-terminal domain-containing protein [candidate division Zixibacteria bacterium]|nr:cytochrome b N-terminal domain-containing protein [candidate division Zixibacteria bacterium]